MGPKNSAANRYCSHSGERLYAGFPRHDAERSGERRMRVSCWPIAALICLTVGTLRAQDMPRPLPLGKPPCLLPDPTDPSLSPQRPTMLPDCSPPPPSPAQLALIAEYRLMTSRWRDSDFALNDPGTNLFAPQGPVVSVPGSAHSGFRVGVAYRAGGSPWEFGVFY